MNKFFTNFKKEVKESYKEGLFKIFFFIGKKLFTVVSSISPNAGESFVIFSNDAKLVELVKAVATPTLIISKPVVAVQEKVKKPRKPRVKKAEVLSISKKAK